MTDDATCRALISAVAASPDDDTPRLVFADWLDDQGAPEAAARAEFIRVQCELARTACRCQKCASVDSDIPPRLCIKRLTGLQEREAVLWFGGVAEPIVAAFRDAVPMTRPNWGWGVTIDPDHKPREDGNLVVARGFPAVARLTLGQFAGLPCTRTDCFNEDGDGPEPECPRCNGTGFLRAGLAAALGAVVGLTAICPTDKEPHESVDRRQSAVARWMWILNEAHPGDPSSLPPSIFHRLRGEHLGGDYDWVGYPDRDAARRDLSDLLLADARAEANARRPAAV